jgi:hypothetical protein
MSRTDKDEPLRVRNPDYLRDRRYYYTWGPRREDRHLYWWGPDRAHTRSLLKSAAREHRAAGSVVSQPEPRQHRHAPYNGGWWD